MKALDYAIRTENWELAALCLLVGAVEALEALPPDAVDELLAELDVEVGEDAARRRHERVLRPFGGLRAQDERGKGRG